MKRSASLDRVLMSIRQHRDRLRAPWEIIKIILLGPETACDARLFQQKSDCCPSTWQCRPQDGKVVCWRFLAPGVGANKANASRIQVYQAQLHLVESAARANMLMLMLNKWKNSVGRRSFGNCCTTVKCWNSYSINSLYVDVRSSLLLNSQRCGQCKFRKLWLIVNFAMGTWGHPII